MKQVPKIAFTTLVLFGFGLLLWMALVPGRECYIRGKPLSQLLEGYGNCEAVGSGLSLQTDLVVREAGTNAIPTLLRILERRDDAAWKLKMLGYLESKHFVKTNYVPADLRKHQAYFAFIELGPRAKGAVPRLLRIYERSASGSSRNYSARSLGAIGPDASAAVPALLKGVGSTNSPLRLSSLGALWQIHSCPDLVIPVFMNCLNDSNIMARYYAIRGLEAFGAEAQPAVPALATLLNDSDLNVRGYATNALNLIKAQILAEGGPR